MAERRAVLAGLAVLPFAARGVIASGRGTLVYIGTHGASILAAHLDPATGALTSIRAAAAIERPTWLAIDPRRRLLFATSETGGPGAHGKVASFAIGRDGQLTQIGSADSGGGAPTFVGYAPKAATLFAANFAGGQVAAIPIAADGSLGSPASVQTSTGTPGSNKRQGMAHAHAAYLDPSGRFVLVPDLGVDRLFVYRFDPGSRALTPADPAYVALPTGSGPRHLAFSRDGRFAYLVTELSAEIRAFRWDARDGTLTPMQTIPLNVPALTEEPSGGEIAISADGRFLYASERVANRIMAFAIDRGGGRLTRIQDVSTRGVRPRSFGIDPSGRWMLVGNERSNTIALFAVDRVSGKLAPVGDPIPTPLDPVAFVFLPES